MQKLGRFALCNLASAIIARGGERRAVAHQLLHSGQIGAGIEKIAGKGAAKVMWREVCNTGGNGSASEHVPDRLSGKPLAMLQVATSANRDKESAKI